MFSLQVAVSCSLVRLRSLRSSAGFSSAPQSQTAALHEAVGNRNTMAATLSLTQVTLSYNSNITAVNESGPLSSLPGDACLALT